MTSIATKAVYFGPFEVADQVFYSTPLCFGLVNVKPLVEGHVLVIPHRGVERFADLSTAEITDVFTTVQKVQKMLAKIYFSNTNPNSKGTIEDGSFNIGIQDGFDAGMTVPHFHCHIIPRVKGNNYGDEIYERMTSEEGNVGGGLWDMTRPKQGGKVPQIEDADRKTRSREEMRKVAAFFREQMASID